MLVLTFLGMIGAPQIILIIAVVLLLFGGRKIPELMKGLGSGIKEFKNATKEEEDTPKVEKEKNCGEKDKNLWKYNRRFKKFKFKILNTP